MKRFAGDNRHLFRMFARVVIGEQRKRRGLLADDTARSSGTGWAQRLWKMSLGRPRSQTKQKQQGKLQLIAAPASRRVHFPWLAWLVRPRRTALAAFDIALLAQKQRQRIVWSGFAGSKRIAARRASSPAQPRLLLQYRAQHEVRFA